MPSTPDPVTPSGEPLRLRLPRKLLLILTTYILLGVVTGVLWAPAIADPVERARINNLLWIARGLWFVGAFSLVFVSCRLSQLPRWMSIILLFMPVLWFGYTTWVLSSSPPAAKQFTDGGATWFVSPRPWDAHGQGAVVWIDDTGVKPTELTIPASARARVAITNTGAVDHTFVIDGLPIRETILGWKATGFPNTHYLDIDARPGDYRYHCGQPGHEMEVSGTLHVVEAPVVVDIVFDGQRLGPQRVEIPADTMVAIRVTNASSRGGEAIRVQISGITVANSVYDNILFIVRQGDTATLMLRVPPGAWRFWGISASRWEESGWKEGDIPGGLLVSSTEVHVP